MSETKANLSHYNNHARNSFETAVIIHNPDNPNAKEQAENAQSRLKKLIGEIIIEKSQPDTASYGDLLNSYDGQDKNTVWVTVGGDGTFSNFANAKPESPIIINPAGTANDLGHMLHWVYTYGHPERILKWGRVAELRPLEITAQAPDGSQPFTELAFGYWGAGLSGHVAKKIGSNEHRTLRDSKTALGKFLVDRDAVIGTLQTIPSLKLTENDNEQFRYELQYVNGSRFAKVFRVGKGQLLEPKAHRVELGNSKTMGLMTTMGKTALVGGELQLSGDDLHKFKIESETATFQTQRDGENKEHLSGTTFTVKLSDYSAKVLTSHRNDLLTKVLL